MIGSRKDIIEYLLTRTDEEVFEIKEHLDKRSNDANGYCWVLCGKLAKVLRTTKEEIYKKHIRDMATFHAFLIKDEAIDSFEKQWTDKHIGRFIETKNSFIDGFTNVLAYYGSSDYSKKDMALLLDSIIEECNEQKIPTVTPEELERLKAEWR